MQQILSIDNLSEESLKLISEKLTGGEVLVLPTDTIYGLVTSAFSKKGVEKIYYLKERSEKKPFIIHISSLTQLKKFKIKPDNSLTQFLLKIWPGPFSVILPCLYKKFLYLHRGTNGLAFRLIEYQPLKSIIDKTGPLVGTSVNIEGEKPAENIEEATRYFGDKVSIYLDTGHLSPIPSTVIKIKDKKVDIIRQGAGVLREYDD